MVTFSSICLSKSGKRRRSRRKQNIYCLSKTQFPIQNTPEPKKIGHQRGRYSKSQFFVFRAQFGNHLWVLFSKFCNEERFSVAFSLKLTAFTNCQNPIPSQKRGYYITGSGIDHCLVAPTLLYRRCNGNASVDPFEMVNHLPKNTRLHLYAKKGLSESS